MGRGAFRENCYDLGETPAAPKLDHHLVGKSPFKRRTEVFSFYIIGEMFGTNELLWMRLAFAYLFLVRDT